MILGHTTILNLNGNVDSIIIQIPTTSFLTAATFIYTIGAGITAGAGPAIPTYIRLEHFLTRLIFASSSVSS